MKMHIICYLMALLLPSSLLAVVALVHASHIVRSHSGTFHGLTKEAANGLTYKAFLGIPYAQPPVGELRFRPPVPLVLEGKGDYYATEFKPFCIQINPVKTTHDFGLGEEDCLYLNVYSPNSAGEQGSLKKVFVFVHGGGNMNGMSDLYLPGRLVTEKDVIVVTINYRLGYLGFLSSLSPECEGNFGLLDQLLAISWVKENIVNFGGDSYDITIGGESAGGIDVSFLNLVPHSRDLFTRSISFSGMSGVAQPLVVRDPKATFVQIAKQFECLNAAVSDPKSQQEMEEIVECLRGVPAEKFGFEAIVSVPDIGPVAYGDLFPGPLVNLFNDKNYLDSINFYERAYFISLCYNEGDIFNVVNENILANLPEEQRKAIPPNAMQFNTFSRFLSDKFGPVSNQVVAKVIEYYNWNYEVNPLADFSADAIFHIPTLQWAAAATKGLATENNKIRLFRFVHWPKMLTGPYKGLIHGMDLLYLFDLDPEFINKIINLHVNGSLWDDTEEYLKNKYLSIIGDFINTGNPALSLEEDLPGGWPPFDEQEGHYLQFGLTPQIKTQLKADGVQLWSQQIPEWIREYPLEQPVHLEL
ncbi:cocaine esterase-like isoform X3 [Biomphalaria glabrata]|uniref:Carboxylic ester hydrolase n=1 Tax=Biomphalaria glabrata TaxID=6526 RepID=A0A9W3AIV5_BIOGL|nr:cocaine esterase-like isoform X3 [Biomphalaria glabrata]